MGFNRYFIFLRRSLGNDGEAVSQVRKERLLFAPQLFYLGVIEGCDLRRDKRPVRSQLRRSPPHDSLSAFVA